MLARYGSRGFWVDGYEWISEIEGYNDGSGTAHLYLCDGFGRHVDHLTAAESGHDITFHSQRWGNQADGAYYNVHEICFLKDAGLIGLNRQMGVLYHWDSIGDLANSERTDIDWPIADTELIHIRQSLGRLITVHLDDLVGWQIQSFVLDIATLDNPTEYPRDHWQLTDSPIYLTEDYNVLQGEELIIDAGVSVLLDQNVRFFVHDGGKLTVNGTSGNPVSFAAMDSGEEWEDIYVKRGQIDIQHAVFTGAGGTASIVTDHPRIVTTGDYPVWLRNCSFEGRGLYLSGSPAELQRVEECTITNVPIGYDGLYTNNSDVYFFETSITNCAERNTFLQKTTGGFVRCTFEGRASKYGVVLATPTCNPSFVCCEFKDLGTPSTIGISTVYLAQGCSPLFGKAGDIPRSANVFSDDIDFLLSIEGEDGPYPIFKNVVNDFFQNAVARNGFVQWIDPPDPGNSKPLILDNQYWNINPTIDRFYPDNPVYWSLNNPATSPYGLCGDPGALVGGDGGNRGNTILDESDPYIDTLLYAIALEDSGVYSEALVLYESIVSQCEESSIQWAAASRLVTTDSQMNTDPGVWIPNAIDDLVVELGESYEAILAGQRIKANYYVNHSDYVSAIEICLNLLAGGLESSDSIHVANDLVGIQLTASTLGEDGDGLDSEFSRMIPRELLVTSIESGVQLTQSLFENLRDQNIHYDEVPVYLPSAFHLYQNYPNPFNPTTEIKYDLPEASRVRLTIYNTLGQEVITLRDNIQAAGQHILTWDGLGAGGSEVATGMYIYRFQAGRYVDSKKMLLLR